MTAVSVAAMAEAFGLADPIGPAQLLRQRGQVAAWRLDTDAGPVLVKRFWADDELPWQAQLELALQVERHALRAGIDTPAPIDPEHPVFGTVARITGQGLFRAFPYLDHRPLADDDDVADWVGTTMALTHHLHPLGHRPEPNWWYCQFPPVPVAQWSGWVRDGESADACWAPALRTHLDLVLEQAQTVVETFNSSPPYALSHRDVESWNVLITDAGPVLIDWDAAGPESIPLEAAYVFIAFAHRGRNNPDPDSVRRSHRAYVAAGGRPLVAKHGLLDRMIGQQLAKLAEDLSRFFRDKGGPSAGQQIRDRIERFPAVVANARAWERLFG